MVILGCDMVTFGDCLRRSVLVFPMEMALALWSDGWHGFFLWGGISVVHQRETVQYDWDGESAIYKGIVESVPEVRGKHFGRKCV